MVTSVGNSSSKVDGAQLALCTARLFSAARGFEVFPSLSSDEFATVARTVIPHLGGVDNVKQACAPLGTEAKRLLFETTGSKTGTTLSDNQIRARVGKMIDFLRRLVEHRVIINLSPTSSGETITCANRAIDELVKDLKLFTDSSNGLAKQKFLFPDFPPHEDGSLVVDGITGWDIEALSNSLRKAGALSGLSRQAINFLTFLCKHPEYIDKAAERINEARRSKMSIKEREGSKEDLSLRGVTIHDLEFLRAGRDILKYAERTLGAFVRLNAIFKPSAEDDLEARVKSCLSVPERCKAKEPLTKVLTTVVDGVTVVANSTSAATEDSPRLTTDQILLNEAVNGMENLALKVMGLK